MEQSWSLYCYSRQYLNYPVLLVCLAFSQAKLSRQRKEKLQLRVRADPVSSENDPELVFDGLPGEVEYEVDLSDQQKAELEEEGSDEESVG